MFAYEIQAYLKAGLQLCGQEADGKYMWMGKEEQWKEASKAIINFIWK